MTIRSSKTGYAVFKLHIPFGLAIDRGRVTRKPEVIYQVHRLSVPATTPLSALLIKLSTPTDLTYDRAQKETRCRTNSLDEGP
jgi:hypothetical protein